MANVQKTNDTIRDNSMIPTPYQLTVGEICQLLDIANRDVIDAIAAAFRLGFLQGNHATKNRGLPKLKVPLK